MKKDIKYRLTELDTALKALEIGISNFNKTREEAHLLGVKATLRALIALGGKNMTPLLIDVAKYLNVPLEFYSTAPKKQRDIEPGLVASVIAARSWYVYPRIDLQKFTLEEWLTSPAYFVSKTREYKNRNDVLRQISESEGGAHFDGVVKEIVDELQRQSGSRYNGIQLFLVDLSALVFWLGRRLLLTNDCHSKGIDPGNDERIKKHDEFFNKLHISIM